MGVLFIAVAVLASGPALTGSGFIDVEGGRVWYEKYGDGPKTPLLMLHGGPGVPHNYQLNLKELATDRALIFYDQLGCGKSDRPKDKKLWTVSHFLKELQTVRDQLRLDKVILFGQSWGTMLAAKYVLSGGAPGVEGMIQSSPALSIPLWAKDAKELVKGLSKADQRQIALADKTGNYGSKGYQQAVERFYAQHLYRGKQPSPLLNASMAGMNQELYVAMCGPSEFTPSGSLRNFDVTPFLGQIHIPTLYICGEYDEATPKTTALYAKLTPGSQLVVVKGASHLTNLERPKEYMGAVRTWLDRIGR